MNGDPQAFERFLARCLIPPAIALASKPGRVRRLDLSFVIHSSRGFGLSSNWAPLPAGCDCRGEVGRRVAEMVELARRNRREGAEAITCGLFDAARRQSGGFYELCEAVAKLAVEAIRGPVVPREPKLTDRKAVALRAWETRRRNQEAKAAAQHAQEGGQPGSEAAPYPWVRRSGGGAS